MDTGPSAMCVAFRSAKVRVFQTVELHFDHSPGAFFRGAKDDFSSQGEIRTLTHCCSAL